MSDDPPAPDAGKRDVLREIAEELRGDSGESQQVAAILYRVSDVYDEGEETTPRDVYRNMRTILRVREGSREDLNPEGL